jgi:Protein of unknown function (DUF2752)
LISAVTGAPLRAATVAVGVAAPIVAVLVLDPNTPGHFPACPFRAATGLDCPGCGSLRALHDLAGGNVVGALDHNALLLAFLPVLAVVLGRWVLGRPAGGPTAWRHAPVAALVVLGAWMLVRNLPLFPLDVLGSGAWA